MTDPFSLGAGWLQEHVLLPLLYATGGMEWEEISFNWALFAIYGVGADGHHVRDLHAARAVAAG